MRAKKRKGELIKLTSEEGKIESLLNLLREQIKRGDFGTKGRIPPIARLVKDHGLGRTAVYRVIELLQGEGLVLALGRAYYVNYPILRISGAPLFDKFLERQGLTPVTENIIEPEIAAMPAEIAALFGQAEGVHSVHRVRKHGTAEVPYRLATNWYDLELAGPFLEAMRVNPDLNVAGEIRKSTGVAIAKRHDDVLARLPTSQEAKWLRIVRTAPVAEVMRKFLAEDGRVIFVSNQILVGAYFLLSYDSTANDGRA